MRNEIFEKIRQNRMRYLAEVKDAKNRDSENNENIEENERIVGKDHEKEFYFSDLTGKISINFDTGKPNKLFRVAGRKAKMIYRRLSSFILPKIALINGKVNSTAEKMTNNFYNYSSRFFEDRYEYSDITEVRQGNAIAMMPAVSAENRFSIFEETLNRIWNRLQKVKMIRTIILFMEMDDEVSIKLKRVRESSVEKKIITFREEAEKQPVKVIKIFKTGFATIVAKTVKKVRYSKNQPKDSKIPVFILKPVIYRLHYRLFPAINRFVRRLL